jgi:hypothetical protein
MKRADREPASGAFPSPNGPGIVADELRVAVDHEFRSAIAIDASS